MLIVFFFLNARVSNRIVQTNVQLLVNNDYEHVSISMVGNEQKNIHMLELSLFAVSHR